MKSSGVFKTTLMGGLVFLLPIGFLLLVLGKAFELVVKVSRPVVEKLSIEGLGGLFLVEAMAVAILVVICFCAGLLAKSPISGQKRPASDADNLGILHRTPIRRAHADSNQLVSTEGRPAVSMSINKVSFTNTIDLVDRISAYVDEKNEVLNGTGIDLIIADDQTITTRKAIDIMQRNALLGLMLVLMVCWLFLGVKIAAFVTMGIAFSIAGTFWLLNIMGSSVNIAVLLGVVIVLGMLVDDAVVVVEALYYRIQRGQQAISAALDSLAEVGRPVASAVFTTISAGNDASAS